MAKYVIDESTLQNLAKAIRNVNGETKTYTPDEMIEAVTNIMESATYILVDASGREIPAVYVDSKQVFTATANDIRIGTTAVTDTGITEGEKVIPSYHTTVGLALTPAGKEFSIKITESDRYDYTKLQAIICPLNGSASASVAAEKIVLEDSVYAVGSSSILANITIDHDTKTINLGITNTGSKPCVIRYFTYKEEN